jgi:hypothetical protein
MNNRSALSVTRQITRKPFGIRTSKNLLSQPLHNQHFHDPLGSAHSKGLTALEFLPQLLYFQHLRAPLVTAENKRLITPLDSALTRKTSRKSFRISTYEKHGGRGPLYASSISFTSFFLRTLSHSSPASPLFATHTQINRGWGGVKVSSSHPASDACPSRPRWSSHREPAAACAQRMAFTGKVLVGAYRMLSRDQGVCAPFTKTQGRGTLLFYTTPQTHRHACSRSHLKLRHPLPGAIIPLHTGHGTRDTGHVFPPRGTP